jgi:hypothetical protein
LTLLIVALRRRLGRIGAKGILQSVFRSVVCAVVMGSVIGLVGIWAGPKCMGSSWCLLAWVVGSVGVGTILYGGLAFLFKCPELTAVVSIIRTSLYKKHL